MTLISLRFILSFIGFALIAGEAHSGMACTFTSPCKEFSKYGTFYKGCSDCKLPPTGVLEACCKTSGKNSDGTPKAQIKTLDHAPFCQLSTLTYTSGSLSCTLPCEYQKDAACCRTASAQIFNPEKTDYVYSCSDKESISVFGKCQGKETVSVKMSCCLAHQTTTTTACN